MHQEAGRRPGRPVGLCSTDEEPDRIHLQRGWRRTAALLAAAACASAVALLLAANPDAGLRRRGGDVLLSAEQRGELREARELRRVHASYDRAKARLEQMSTQYTNLGVKLEAAQTRASALRTELETKMRDIRRQFHGAQLQDRASAPGLIMSLAEDPAREQREGRQPAAGLEREVEELKATVRRMGHREVEQATELRQMRQDFPAREEGADVKRFPRRPLLGFRAERVLSREKLAALSRLQSVNLQLDAENRRICELCAQSALLRANRQRTCGICSRHAPGEVQGDTDVPPGREQRAGESSLVGEAMSLFMPVMADAPSPQAPARGGFGWPGPRETSRGSTWMGDIVARAAAISAARNGGTGTGSSTPVLDGTSDAPAEQLVQIDDADHMGTGAMDGTLMTAYVTEGGKRYVVGKCAPSADELKFSASETICDTCKSMLGSDVEALGRQVQCTRV
jgi:hypothetical protein